MFKFKKSTSEQSRKTPIADIGNVPLTAYERGRAVWAEKMGDATVNQGRLFVIAALCVIAVLAMAVALAGLSPLKAVVPYTIHVDKVTGETRAIGITAERFEPNEQQKRYHLGKWVKQVMSLDAFTTERDLSEAYQMVRSKAIDEFREYLTTAEPIARLRADTTLTRTVQISTIQFLADNIAMVRVTTQERSARDTKPAKPYAVLVHFAIEPPRSDAEIYRNPIGLYVTHFTISEELL